uniref:Carboxylesterase type B domain-containing protein n=1 Tax=Phlebotomus papatasi TaxID=29031 RepID=A0A1B0EYZ8_PHLPP
FIKTRANSPGSNLAILDILAALQWTRDNIAAFGGDPSRLTIVGHDTGAALANLVLISKSSKETLFGVGLRNKYTTNTTEAFQFPTSACRENYIKSSLFTSLSRKYPVCVNQDMLRSPRCITCNSSKSHAH